MENHSAKELILACWDNDHARRPDAFQILQTLIAIQFKSASLRNGFCGPLTAHAQHEHNNLEDGIRAVRNGHLEPIEDNAVFSATIHLGFVTTAVALCSLDHRLLTKPRVQWLPYNSFVAPLTGLLAQWLSTRSSEQCLEVLAAFVMYTVGNTPIMIKIMQHYRTVLQRHGMAIWKILLHPGARSTIFYDKWTHKDRLVFQQCLIPIIDQVITVSAYRDAILTACETWIITSLDAHWDYCEEVYALSDLVGRVIHLCVNSYALPDPAMFVKAFHKSCEDGNWMGLVKCLYRIPGITEKKDESGRNGLQLAFKFGNTDVFHLLRNVMSSSVENLDFNFDSWRSYEDTYEDAPPTHFVRTILQKYPELVHSIVTPNTLAQLCTPGISEEKELASTLKLLRKWVVAPHYICSDPRPFLRIMFIELCRNGRYYALKWLLRDHPELVSTNDLEGNSGLLLACKCRNAEAGDVVKLLYRKGQRLPVSAPGMDLFSDACARNNIFLVKMLLDWFKYAIAGNQIDSVRASSSIVDAFCQHSKLHQSPDTLIEWRLMILEVPYLTESDYIRMFLWMCERHGLVALLEKLVELCPRTLTLPTIKTGFEAACKKGSIQIIKKLFQTSTPGTRMSFDTSNGVNLACAHMHDHIIEWLQEQGHIDAKLVEADRDVFNEACKRGRCNIIKLLVGVSCKPELVYKSLEEDFSGFHIACMRGQIPVIDIFLSIDRSLIHTQSKIHSWTGFQLACRHGQFGVVQHLVSKDATVMAPVIGQSQNSGYLLACELEYGYIAYFLLEKQSIALGSAKAIEGVTRACRHGSFGTVTAIVQLHQRIRPSLQIFTEAASVKWWEEGLYEACKYGKLEIVKYIIGNCLSLLHRRPIASSRGDGLSGFLVACIHGHSSVVEWMITAHKRTQVVKWSEVNLYKEGFSLACQHGNLEVIKVIVEQCRQILLVAVKHDQTGFAVACEEGQLDVVQWFLQCARLKVSLYSAGFVLACGKGMLNVIECILDSDFRAPDAGGIIVGFNSACRNGQLEVVKLLLNRWQPDGILTSWSLHSGTNGLHEACISSHANRVQIAHCILQLDATLLGVRTTSGKHCIQLAADHGNLDLLECFKEFSSADKNPALFGNANNSITDAELQSIISDVKDLKITRTLINLHYINTGHE